MKFLVAYTEARPHCNPDERIVNEIVELECGERVIPWFQKEKEKRYKEFEEYERSYYPLNFLGYWFAGE